METCTVGELFLIICFGISLSVRLITSLVIFMALLADFKSEALLLVIFDLLCFLLIIFSLIIACLSKNRSNSSDNFRYESISEFERRKKNYYSYLKKFLICMIISYLFSIGIIEEYARINSGYMSKNTKTIFKSHIIGFIVEIISGGIYLCVYSSEIKFE